MAELEDESREDVIRYNIQDFLPYICDCVKATDLLSHLHFYTSEQRKEIFRLCGQNNVTGMQKAMQVLLHEIDDRGRFTAFRKAIEDSEYPKIVKMLDGESVAYDENCRKLINLFAKEIIGRLNPEDLLPSLVREGVLTGNDTDEVRAEERNHGKVRACWVLLFHLPNRVEYWFRSFMDALIDTDYSDIAEILEPDLFQKIKLQREEAIKASANLKDDNRENVLTDVSKHTDAEEADDNVDEVLDFDFLLKDNQAVAVTETGSKDPFEHLNLDHDVADRNTIAMAFLEEQNDLDNGREQNTQDGNELNIFPEEVQKEYLVNGMNELNVFENPSCKDLEADDDTDETFWNVAIDLKHMNQNRNQINVGKYVSKHTDDDEADDYVDEVLDFDFLLNDNQSVAVTETGSKDPLEHLNIEHGVADRITMACQEEQNDLDNGKEQNTQDEIKLNIFSDPNSKDFSDKPENPKLVKMQEIVSRTFDKNFEKTRELVQALVNWMKETKRLNTLYESNFVGQAASKAERGMTKCEQKDVLEFFKGGRHKTVVESPVVEKELDITKCNLVKKCKHGTNEVGRLQSRGCARMQDSRHNVLTEEGSWIVAEEEKNVMLKNLRNNIVPKLQAGDHPNHSKKNNKIYRKLKGV